MCFFKFKGLWSEAAVPRIDVKVPLPYRAAQLFIHERSLLIGRYSCSALAIGTSSSFIDVICMRTWASKRLVLDVRELTDSVCTGLGISTLYIVYACAEQCKPCGRLGPENSFARCLIRHGSLICQLGSSPAGTSSNPGQGEPTESIRCIHIYTSTVHFIHHFNTFLERKEINIFF